MNDVFIVGKLRYISDSKKNKTRFPKTTLGIAQSEIVLGNQKFDKTFIFLDLNKDNAQMERDGINRLLGKTILIASGSIKTSRNGDKLYLNVTASNISICKKEETSKCLITLSGFVKEIGSKSFLLNVPKKKTPKTTNFDPYEVPIYMPDINLDNIPNKNDEIIVEGFYGEVQGKKFIIAKNIIKYERFRSSQTERR